MQSMTKVTRSIAIGPETLKAVQAYADATEQSLSAVVQLAIQQYLAERGVWPLKTPEPTEKEI